MAALTASAMETQMHRDVGGLGHHVAGSVKDGARVIPPLLDVGGIAVRPRDMPISSATVANLFLKTSSVIGVISMGYGP